MRSMVCIGRTVTPGVSAGTRTWVDPAPVRPVTSRWLAWAADSTGSLGAVQHEVPTIDPDLEREVVEPVVGPGLEVPPRGDRRTGQQAGEEVGVAVGRQGADGAGDDVGGHQRTRGGVAPELVGHQGEVTEAVPADRPATVLLGNQQRGPAQLGALGPVAADRSRRARRGAVGCRSAWRARSGTWPSCRGRTPGPTRGSAARTAPIGDARRREGVGHGHDHGLRHSATPAT